jgi:phosphate transport system substrate-binding protein
MPDKSHRTTPNIHTLRCAAAAVAILFACSFFPAQALAKEIIKIGGTGCALGAMKLIADAFEQAYPQYAVRVLPSLDSSGGIMAVTEGAIDIGLSSRPLKDEERTKGIIIHEYGRTPFIFAANGRLNMRGLSTAELVEIYSGRRQSWDDGRRIRLVLRPRADSDNVILRKISADMDRAVEEALSRKGMLVGLTSQDSNILIERTPGAMGTTTLTEWIAEKRSFQPLSFNGIKPTVATLAEGRYPLVRPLYLILPPRQSGPVKHFVKFVSSRQGQRILEENGIWVSGKRTAH